MVNLYYIEKIDFFLPFQSIQVETKNIQMIFGFYFSHTFLTMFGMILGLAFRCEHHIKPLHEDTLRIWPILSLLGFLFSSYTDLFFLMNMITISWFICDYLHKIHLIYYKKN